jgi:hypothetical protein
MNRTRQNTPPKGFLGLAHIFAMCVYLGGCGEPSEVNVSLSGINYTDEYISDFLVNGYSGANVLPHIGGGSYVCCVTIPRHWRPGLSATVRWTKNYTEVSSWKQKIVSIPQYKPEEIGFIAVHFYTNDDVKILITKKSNWVSGYPYPEPSAHK